MKTHLKRLRTRYIFSGKAHLLDIELGLISKSHIISQMQILKVTKEKTNN